MKVKYATFHCNACGHIYQVRPCGKFNAELRYVEEAVVQDPGCPECGYKEARQEKL